MRARKQRVGGEGAGVRGGVTGHNFTGIVDSSILF